MKTVGAIVLVLLATTILSAADVSGEWEFAAKVLNGVNYARVTLNPKAKS